MNWKTIIYIEPPSASMTYPSGQVNVDYKTIPYYDINSSYLSQWRGHYFKSIETVIINEYQGGADAALWAATYASANLFQYIRSIGGTYYGNHTVWPSMVNVDGELGKSLSSLATYEDTISPIGKYKIKSLSNFSGNVFSRSAVNAYQSYTFYALFPVYNVTINGVDYDVVMFSSKSKTGASYYYAGDPWEFICPTVYCVSKGYIDKYLSNTIKLTLNVGDIIVFHGEAQHSSIQNFLDLNTEEVPAYQSVEAGLYKNTADSRIVDKSNYLEKVADFNGTIRDDCDIVRPIVRVQYDTLPDFNYIGIAELNRYYYVTDVKYIAKGLWELYLECDVLMTWKDGIRQCTAFVDRNAFPPEESGYITDSMRVVEQGENVYTVPMTQEDEFFSETGNCYVLDAYWTYPKNGL